MDGKSRSNGGYECFLCFDTLEGCPFVFVYTLLRNSHERTLSSRPLHLQVRLVVDEMPPKIEILINGVLSNTESPQTYILAK